MIQLRAAAAAFAAGLALVACQPTKKEPVASAGGGLAIAPLEYTSRELPNGLRVYAIPDSSTASVSVAVWYDVGSKDDPAGRSGFAHPNKLAIHWTVGSALYTAFGAGLLGLAALFGAVLIILSNLIVDVMYAYLDRRVVLGT